MTILKRFFVVNIILILFLPCFAMADKYELSFELIEKLIKIGKSELEKRKIPVSDFSGIGIDVSTKTKAINSCYNTMKNSLIRMNELHECQGLHVEKINEENLRKNCEEQYKFKSETFYTITFGNTYEDIYTIDDSGVTVLVDAATMKVMVPSFLKEIKSIKTKEKKK